jgi:hypothetical protein
MAEFLSPRVASLRSADNTILELSIGVDDKNDLFSSFVSLGRGHVFSGESGTRSTFLSLCSELWNEELYENVSDSHDKVLTIENVIDRMEHKKRMRHDISNEIEFIASPEWCNCWCFLQIRKYSKSSITTMIHFLNSHTRCRNTQIHK